MKFDVGCKTSIDRERVRNEIDSVLELLCDRYSTNKRGILTEGDIVNQTHQLLKETRICESFNYEIHSELRPFDPITNKFIRNDKWTKDGRINYASKFDLCLIDSSPEYWKQTFRRIALAQTKTESDVKYWRFLLYPYKAFKAVLEFKIRVRGNTSRIKKDIIKLESLHEKNPCCLKYLVVMDRVAKKKSLNSIREKVQEKNFIKPVLIGYEEVLLRAR